jgi:hypothetical protein
MPKRLQKILISKSETPNKSKITNPNYQNARLRNVILSIAKNLGLSFTLRVTNGVLNLKYLNFDIVWDLELRI